MLLMIASPARAATDIKVSISENIEGSSNRIEIDSNSENSKQASDSYEGSTSVKINQNGEVKEYKGSGSNVDLKTSDGKSSVSIRNNQGDSPQDGASPSAVATESAEASIAGIIKESEPAAELNISFWENLTERISIFFKKYFEF